MGRKLYRVPLGFDWPIGKAWEGYQNPHQRSCPHCDNGDTVAGQYLDAIVSLLLSASSDAVRGRRSPVFDRLSRAPREVPTEELTQLTAGLAGRAPTTPLGHDISDEWEARKKIVKAAGLDPKTFGICPHCHGTAVDPAVAEAVAAWRRLEPPVGDGYQLWDTTSDGAPLSPVFASLQELAAWCERNATTFGNFTATAAQWEQMLLHDTVGHQEGAALFI